MPLHELLGENLAGLQLGGLAAGSENAQTALLEFVDEAQRQGDLRADDRQVDAGLKGEIGQPLDVRVGDGPET